MPARLARAEVYWLEGKPGEAAREAELADEGSAVTTPGTAARSPSGYSASHRLARRTMTSPSAAGGRLTATGPGAAELWTELGCPYEVAAAPLGATDEHALRGALTIFWGLGASAPARVTRQKMRRLGIQSIPVGPQTATCAHPLGLTKREREVLDLICAGQTNAEIAAHLFISAKTVDHPCFRRASEAGCANPQCRGVTSRPAWTAGPQRADGQVGAAVPAISMSPKNRRRT